MPGPIMLAAASLIPIVSAPASICGGAYNDGHFGGESIKSADEGRVVQYVGPDPVEPGATPGPGQRAFDPTHDGRLTGQFFEADLDRPDPVVHPSLAVWSGTVHSLSRALSSKAARSVVYHRPWSSEPLHAALAGDVDPPREPGPSTSDAVDPEIPDILAGIRPTSWALLVVNDVQGPRMPGGKHHCHRAGPECLPVCRPRPPRTRLNRTHLHTSVSDRGATLGTRDGCTSKKPLLSSDFAQGAW